ncbi:MAG: CysS/YqeB C-terminal domain-containing protein, partial [Thermoplasmataceae archaeon]
SRAEASGTLEVFRWADSFLSVIFSGDFGGLSPKTVDTLLKLRESLRAQKMFRESDSIRNALRESGIAIEDNKQGGEWFYE